MRDTIHGAGEASGMFKTCVDRNAAGKGGETEKQEVTLTQAIRLWQALQPSPRASEIQQTGSSLQVHYSAGRLPHGFKFVL